MITTAIFPRRYVQGDGALDLLGEETGRLGNQGVAIVDTFAQSAYGDELQKSLSKGGSFSLETFQGECSDEEIERLSGIAQEANAKVIVGVGGGKALDTSKAVGHRLGLPIAIMPITRFDRCALQCSFRGVHAGWSFQTISHIFEKSRPRVGRHRHRRQGASAIFGLRHG
jgi:glycerol dehydrogenase-like iron-containing ADH family enzyme